MLLTVTHDLPIPDTCPEVTDPDAALLVRVARGDAGAAEAFVRRHRDAVVRFVSRMLGAADPAVDDVVQLAFVAALDGAGRFGGRSAARTWLLGIAANKAKTHLRSRARRTRVLQWFGREASVAKQVQAPMGDRREIGQRIQAALLTLEPTRRAAFVMTEFDGLSSAEAGEALGAPEGTVRRWRLEARRALQAELADLHPRGEAS